MQQKEEVTRRYAPNSSGAKRGYAEIKYLGSQCHRALSRSGWINDNPYI